MSSSHPPRIGLICLVGFSLARPALAQENAPRSQPARAIVSVACFVAQRASLFWPARPDDLAPDETALRLDLASARPIVGDDDLKTYDVKETLAGSFAGKMVVVRSPKPNASCLNLITVQGADVVAGVLATDTGQGLELVARVMPEGRSERVAALRTQAQAGSAEGMLRLGLILGKSPEAERWFQAAADKGDTDAMRILATPRFSDASQARIWNQRRYAAIEAQATPGDAKALIAAADSIVETYSGGAINIETTDLQPNGTRLIREREVFQNRPPELVDGWGEDVRRALGWYQAAADLGDASAARQIGEMYLHGWGVPVDAFEADRWLTRAAIAGDQNAGVGWRQEEDAGLFPLDPSRPHVQLNLAYWLARANAGDTGAMVAIAEMYSVVTGEVGAAPTARKWFQKAADAGDPAGMLRLARQPVPPRLAAGAATPGDLRTRARAILTERANAGDLVATLRLAQAYDEADFGEADPVRAAVLWRQAADQGEAGAMRALGDAYAKGRGVKQDAAQALVYYGRAADRGDLAAMTRLAGAYENGWYTPRDSGLARQWRDKVISTLQSRAESGDSGAMEDLARMYERGEGVTANPTEAMRWREMAADAGQPLALRVLGYQEAQLARPTTKAPSEELLRHAAQARLCYGRAADMGDVVSMLALAALPVDSELRITGRARTPAESAQVQKDTTAQTVQWRTLANAAGAALQRVNIYGDPLPGVQ